MSAAPVSDEIAGALGLFFHGGAGPSHSSLTGVFTRSGYGDVADYRPGDPAGLNKEQRVQLVVRTAVKRPTGARSLIDGLLTTLRLHGCFEDSATDVQRAVETAQSAFRRAGWSLGDGGTLNFLGAIDLVTVGRPALDEQVERLRRSTDDPGQLIGSAKDLLEATAKFVLEELTGTSDDGHDKLPVDGH